MNNNTISDQTSSNTLEYNQGIYKEFYQQGHITPFNHGPLSGGPIDDKAVPDLIQKLNEKSSTATPAVRFNPTRVEKTLTGGSCSAIAIKIAKLAINRIDQSTDSADLLESIKTGVDEIGQYRRGQRKAMRTLQATFNTIEVDKTLGVSDFDQEKITALVSHYDLTVSETTPEISVANSSSCENQFIETTQSLKCGVYLMRVIIKEDNHKLETQGHSTIYIKRPEGVEFYFDTQLGLWDLSKITVTDKTSFIFRSVCSMKQKFEVDYCKFHKLEKLSQTRAE